MESGPPTVPPYVAGPLRLAAFRALWLAPRRVGDPASARLFARPYRGAGQRLEDWCKRGLATRDDEPAVYLHEYTESGLTVRGLVGCLDISRPARSQDERQVFPHEGVHPGQVSELASRMDSMRIHPAPIILLHHGPASVREVSSRVRARPPERAYLDHAGQKHRIWAITDPSHLEAIASGLADARLLVADGHHRYAAYVALHGSAPETHHDGLAMVIDQEETPLFLGAIHRLWHHTTVPEVVRSAAAAGGTVRTTVESEAMAALAPDTVVVTDGQRWATARLEVPARTTMVQLLDECLLAGLSKPPSRVGFAHSVGQALDEVRPGRVTAALLPAVQLELVLELARSGTLLPEKATSFQPKPSLGSFIRLLDG